MVIFGHKSGESSFCHRRSNSPAGFWTVCLKTLNIFGELVEIIKVRHLLVKQCGKHETATVLTRMRVEKRAANELQRAHPFPDVGGNYNFSISRLLFTSFTFVFLQPQHKFSVWDLHQA